MPDCIAGQAAALTCPSCGNKIQPGGEDVTVIATGSTDVDPPISGIYHRACAPETDQPEPTP